jgi:7,8-dihydropterin-6-yl-methyl-4-(beta-D-ribofuranosyl)aminobenzene 5'-phosphate synthase
MIIKTLVENTSISEEFKSEHGHCLYIETKKHKLLFDLGASVLFVENAKKLSADLSEVDLVVISHGHYDHGGGLRTFISLNSNAKIYLNQKAFDKHYANRPDSGNAYIGLDTGLLPNDRFVFVGNHITIDDELELFSNVKGRKLYPSGNQDLFMEQDASLMIDDFVHEQNLIIKEDSKTFLVAGCSHNGIINIIEHMIDIKGSSPQYVIGGFHLYNRSANKNEDPGIVKQIGEYLKNNGAKTYTCHCTGAGSYKILKGIMGEQIQYLATGSQLFI